MYVAMCQTLTHRALNAGLDDTRMGVSMHRGAIIIASPKITRLPKRPEGPHRVAIPQVMTLANRPSV